MKVMFRTTVKIVPGKMAEYIDIEAKGQAMESRCGMPPRKSYSPLTGDSMHKIVYYMEFDSLAALENSFDKMLADPERQEIMAKYEGTVLSHENELCIPKLQNVLGISEAPMVEGL